MRIFPVVFTARSLDTTRGVDVLDVVRVGEPKDLPFSADDAEVLLWAAREGRILVTEDKHTMPGHLADHLATGHHCPGVFLVRPSASIPDVLEYLILVAYITESHEWENRIVYIP